MEEMVLVPKSLLSCATSDGLDVQDVLDNLTGADWHSGSWVPQTATEHRSAVIRELIKKAEDDGRTFQLSKPISECLDRRQHAQGAADWLKSQMEGE